MNKPVQNQGLLNGRITTGFLRAGDKKLKDLCFFIYNMLVNNEAFAGVTPTIADVFKLYTAYSQALANADTRSTPAIALKNEARQKLVAIYKLLAASVMQISQGNYALLATTGFPLAKTTRTPAIIVTPVNFTVADGNNPLELLLQCDAQKGAKGYLFQYTMDPVTATSVWITIPASKSSVIISNLTHGQIYWCRAVVLGSKNQAMYGTPASRMVQ